MAATTATPALRLLFRPSRAPLPSSRPSTTLSQRSKTRYPTMTRHSSTTTKPPTTSLPLPSQIYDSHMHIISPNTTLYPFSPTTTYTPPPHTLSDMSTFYSSLSPSTIANPPTFHPVFIQPSPYATDNSLLLSALSQLQPNARGVVVINPDSPPPADELRRWHDLGVRGVRLNFVSVNRTLSEDELEAELRRYVDVLRGVDRGWVLQLYIRMADIPSLEKVVGRGVCRGVRVVIDHLGSPDLPPAAAARTPGQEGGLLAVDPRDLEGFQSLLNLLEAGETFVKISGAYRSTRSGDLNEPSDLDLLVKALLRARGGERCIWASDWPHTRFEDKGIDSGKWMERLCGLVGEVEREEVRKGSWFGGGWVGSKEEGEEGVGRRVERLFWGNAEEVWR